MPAPRQLTPPPPAPPDHTAGWWQVNIEFKDWSRAEQTATEHLVPLLHRLQRDNHLGDWWFMRKHPCWRLRLRSGRAPEHTAAPIATRGSAGTALDEMVSAGWINRWWPVIYEPETAAFGGPSGTDTAHTWFSADSRAILTPPILTPPVGAAGLGRRELSLLLCTTMLRAAGLEWYEQGDVWYRVTRERPLPDTTPPAAVESMAADLRHLLLTDLAPTGPLLTPDGPLAGHREWFAAAREAGAALGATARDGHLTRGLRNVLAYHVIFHWNRLGLPPRTQAVIARAARIAVLDLPLTQPAPPPPTRRPTRPVETTTTCRQDDAHDVVGRVLARFPLLARPQLRCPDLPTRLHHISEHATAAHRADHPEDRIERACSAWNLAALLAADCAMTGLAQDLCRQQYALFQPHRPLAGRTAIAALQPVINLIRLDARTGHPDRALDALTALDHTIRHGGTTRIADLDIDSGQFSTSASDRTALHAWLRTVLCEDGTRFAAATGDRARAAAHAARFDDTPERLHEARQTAIIHHALDGEPDVARQLLDTSTLHDPEDHALAAVLRAALPASTLSAARPGDVESDHHAAAVARVKTGIAAASTPAASRFHVRLGLAAFDLLIAPTLLTTPGPGGIDSPALPPTIPPEARSLLAALAARVARAGDAQAARELLRHHVASAHLFSAERAELAEFVRDAGLGCSAALAPHLTALMGVLDEATTALLAAVNLPTCSAAMRVEGSDAL